ncbi:MAG TPA: 2'-5' RNA ligase family protein [Mycobacteriales bacterium]
MPSPLVVTLVLDEVAQARFDAKRAALFPAGRTAVGAHVTLFHALPGEHADAVGADLAAAADRPPFPVAVTGLQPLGRGVAYRLRSAELAAVHARLRARWEPWLTRQDAQPFRPHVTVQNKVTPEQARETLARLEAGFVPGEVTATGLALWAYAGGPWEPLSRFPFGPGPAVP